LNKENKRTACGETWTPRLVWFLLKLLFDSDTKPKHHLAKKTEIAEPPRKKRILRSLTQQPENASLAASKFSKNRLTADEIAKRLSLLGRIVREQG
jgi:hypothetical protein